MANKTTTPSSSEGLAEAEKVTVTIDGREVAVPRGSLVVDAASSLGIHIPIYCAHPKLDPVAVCRMCLVRVGKMPRLQPACATVVSDGMVVTTQSPEVAKVREGMLEFLLLNHPLDCPVCDRGGECDLQDFAVRYGPQTSRFPITQKSHAAKAVVLSDKIELDQERCILCWRCTRYYDEITGEKELVLVRRGIDTVIDSFNGEPLTSDFQGNLPEVCPVGALTHRQYRFQARPWDLQRTKGICPECSYGCNINIDARDFEIKRFASRDNPQVEDMWLCDRGRYSVEKWSHGSRVRHPLIRAGGEVREVGVDEAVAEAARQLGEVLRLHGGGAIGVIGSPMLTNEELWLLQRLARETLDCHNCDHQLDELGNVSADEHSLGIAEIEDCETVVVLGAEPEANTPVLTLRLHKAQLRRGVEVRRVEHDASPASLGIKGKRLVGVIADEVHRAYAADMADALASGNTLVKRLTVTRGVNGRGAKDMGMLPTQGPGYSRVTGGKDGRQILHAASAGAIKALLLVGAETVLRGAGILAEKALAKVDVIIAIEPRAGIVANAASVVIPGHTYFEKRGSVTNVEGRVQRVSPALPPATAAPQETRVLAMLAAALGATGWGTGDPFEVNTMLSQAIDAYRGAGNGGRALWKRQGEPR